MKANPIDNAVPTLPTVSYVHEDGTMVETVYIPDTAETRFAIRSPDGSVAFAAQYETPGGDQLVPYSGDNNLLATGCVLLSSDVEPFGSKADLVADIRAFIRRYVVISEAYETIAAHYVLLSWVHDAFQELGYLRFRGDYGTGKTRALLVVGSICYKPFFASGASTVSPIFHVLEAFSPTLILDEADFRFSDATADLAKILNNGTVAGLPVLRTMTNRHRELNPQAFRVFGPKIIGMRGSYQDAALESRFLTEETAPRPLPPDIPIHLPPEMRREAAILRNRLLAWRFAARFEVRPDPSRLIEGVSPRSNQTALALLSIIDDEAVRDQVRAELVTGEARVLNERASNPGTVMLGAVLEAFAETTATYVTLDDLAERYFRKNSGKLYQRPTSKWVGWVLRDQLGLTTAKSRGVYVVPQGERPKIEALAKRSGLMGQDATA